MMSHARFTGIHQGLTTLAKHVYDAVPIAERWTPGQVQAEMARRGVIRDLYLVHGALKSLVGSTLVGMPVHNEYIRKPVKAKPISPLGESSQAPIIDDEEEEEEITMAASPTEQSVKPAGPIERLSKLQERALSLANDVKTLARDIEAAALELEQQVQDLSNDTKKLRELRSLLGSI